MSLTWTTPVWMWPLLLVMAAGAVVWTVHVYRRTRPIPDPRLARLLVVLRGAALLALLAAVAGPVLSRSHRQVLPGRLEVVLEDSGSMDIADVRDAGNPDGEPRTRWSSALAFAARVDSALQAANWPGDAVFLRGNGLTPLDEFHLDDPVIPGPTGHGTNLNHLLRQVTDHSVGIPVKAVLLLSDGQETRGFELDRMGSTIGNAGGDAGAAELLVVGVGDPVGSADRLIKDLRYADTAFAGDEVVVELAVSHRFRAGATLPPVTVSISEDGKTIVEKTFPLDRETTHLEVSFPVAGEGLRVFELLVSPLDNERFLANNKVSMTINVRKGRSRILALAGHPGWDLRFLAQAALAEPRIDLSVVYPSAAGPVFADSLVVWRQPESAAAWADWDGVVLLGWDGLGGSLDWPLVGEAVSEGLGLLVLPGPPPEGQRTVAAPPPGLAGLLPVTADRFRWVAGPFFGSVPTGVSGHPVLHLVEGDNATDNRDQGPGLAALPPLRRILGVEPRPGALLLLTGVQREHRDGGISLPLLVLDNHDQGRVVWFGGRCLWELAFWQPGLQARSPGAGRIQPAKRFLQNLLVWLAAGQEESGLVFTGRRAVYQEGERITLGAQWRDMRGQPVLDRELSLVLRSRDGGKQADKERIFALRPGPGPAGLAEVELPPLPPGTYSVQLMGQGDPPVLGQQEILVVTSHSIEETQVRQNQRRLVELADRAGGEYFPLDGATTLEDVVQELVQLDWTGVSRDQRRRLDFWSGLPFLALVGVLLGLEWFLRRRHGLL